MFTTNITLLSGITAEIRLMTGEIQEELFSLVGTNNFQYELAKKIVVKLGNDTNVEDALAKMPPTDFQDLMIQWREASYGKDINVKLKDKEGKTHEVTVEISHSDFAKKAPANTVNNYNELTPTYDLVLPISKKKIRLERLSVKYMGEYAAKAKKVSPLTPLEMRRIVEIVHDEKADKERPIFFDLRAAVGKDIEFIRKNIYAQEGKFAETVQVSYMDFPEQTINPVAEVSFFLQEF